MTDLKLSRNELLEIQNKKLKADKETMLFYKKQNYLNRNNSKEFMLKYLKDLI